MKNLIVTCTQKNKHFFQDTDINKSYNDCNLNKDFELEVFYQNKEGLSKQYNTILNDSKYSEYGWIVFAHDDVYIDDARLLQKLNEAKKLEYDIVGLAGGLNPRIGGINLWHLMTDRKDHRGFVAHPVNEKQMMVTNFGPSPARVAIIDGLFFAVYQPKAKEVGFNFNENYTFHHYDIAASIEANKKKLKIGVYPINVVHRSPGLLSVENPTWKSSNETFIKEYGVKPKDTK
jgi:hypothetical protein